MQYYGYYFAFSMYLNKIAVMAIRAPYPGYLPTL
jgi:hypothetical protein